ncbi:thermonuclease family protein [Thauera sp. ZXT1-4]|jgi:endonuclease YncB( thermonuclease family)|uniref:thermonuclease family protein n=1 Tax=Thauera sp. ZXT1-4 TaxID=3460294 RepID=UPI0040408ABC
MLKACFLAVALSFYACPALSSASEIVGTVVGVADGDTLTVLDSGRREHRVRLAEIDAPEASGQAFGQRAKQALSGLCYRKTAQVTVHTIDRYGRNVGTVTCEGVNANAKMVELGLAWVYKQYASVDSPLIDLERTARQKKSGFGSTRTRNRPGSGA